MIAVDTNVIVYLYVHGEYSSFANRLFESDTEWASAALWRSEFRNVLTLYLRQKVLSVNAAVELMEQAEVLMSAHTYEPATEQVFDLVGRSDCSAYDCEFVAVAQRLQVPLVTADQLLIKAFPETAVPLSEVSKR